MSELVVAAAVCGALLAVALYLGLCDIAAAIRTRTINVNWVHPITVNHRHEVDK